MNLFKLRQYSKIAVKKVAGRMALKRGLADGIARTPPETLYWIQHTQCNLRCPMCNVPQMNFIEEKKTWVETDRMKEVVREAAGWGVPNFGVSGGEPLIWPERLFAVIETAAREGMYTHFGTNGMLVTEEILRRCDDIGVGHISLSADGIGDYHDRMRGRAGVWARGPLNTIELFEKVRPNKTNLKINTVISDLNMENIPVLAEFVARRGYVMFIQPFDPCDYRLLTRCRDAAVFHDKYPQWIPPGRFGLLEDVVRRVLEVEERYPGTLLNDAEHLDAIRRYYSLDIFENPRPCDVAFKNIWVEADGTVRHCFYGNAGNVKELSLRMMWNSVQMVNIRKKMLSCDFVCLAGCMYDLSTWALLKKGLRVARVLLR